MAHQPQKQMGVALPPDLRDRLEAAATAAGHSIAEEIRQRLERTFRQDAPLRPDIKDLLNRIFGLVAIVEYATERRWNDGPGAPYLLQLSIDRLLQRHGAREVREIMTSEAFAQEMLSVATTNPAKIATAIETLLNAKLTIERHLDEAYRHGPAEGERAASLIEAAMDELDAKGASNDR